MQEINLDERAGFRNRHVDGLPTAVTKMNIITNDIEGEHIDLVEWFPFNQKNYLADQMPAEGYLGTARLMSGPYKGIGFHAWKQNNSEFIYYQLIET